MSPYLPLATELGNRYRVPLFTQASIAILATGLVVEFHRSPTFLNRASIWYHIGQVSGGTIQWGPSHRMDLKTSEVAWPQVAVTPQGHVIFTYSDYPQKLSSDLVYWTGRVNPNGDTSQTIDWVQKEVKYDSGFHNNLALAPFYTYGVFADVHENRGSGTSLYYRIGYLRSDLEISWLTGLKGVKYESGINPHLTINSNNQLVEVHQVSGEWLLHYRRGTISAEVPSLSALNFRDSVRYSNQAERPAIAFIGPRQVVDMRNEGGLRFSVGTLSATDPKIVDWTTPTVISVNDNRFNSPAVASNGKVAVAAFNRSNYEELYFSVANVE